MNHDRAATRRAEACNQVRNPIAIHICSGHGKRLHLPRRNALRQVPRTHWSLPALA